MKRILFLCLLVAPPLYARAHLDVAGQRVTVDTDRYKIVVDGLAVTRIENKLTGEVYAAPPDKPAAPGKALQEMLRDQGVAVESLRPAVPVKRFAICPTTKITSRKRGDSVTVTYTGLQYGTGAPAEPATNMTIRLTLRVESKTGDLLITPEVKGNIEEVHGVRDRGVLRNSLHVLDLANTLKIILPAGDGAAFTWANAPAGWADWVQRWNWPMSWEAALFIAESDKGCLGIWADEAPLKYGRYLSLCRSGGRWQAGFEYETSDMIYRCDEIKQATWRLNVFAGYWVKAAERYQQEVMLGQWHMKPLAEQQPAWADKVRVILGSSMPPVSAEAGLTNIFPRDSMAVFTSQGWLQGWNNGDMMKRAENYHPNYPLDNPVRWEGVPEFADYVKKTEALGIHVFPYTNLNQIDTTKNPWIRDKIGDRHFWAWKIWQRFYPELCLDIVQRYGVSAIYEDCSWVLGRHLWGEPDGDNWCNGDVHMHEYFRQLMPDIPIMGERNNEVTARGQQFALGWVRDSANMHPICAYLFEPFVRMWNLGGISFPYQTFDVEDIRGYTITVIDPYHFQDLLQEDRMIMTRAQVFAQEQLNSYWPPTWDTNVMHYFKGKDGTEYRFVRDQGTRFVKLTNGVPETIYWRVTGVGSVAAPHSGVDGWVGYDGERLIGLNPAAQYVVLANSPRPPALITQVPANSAIDRTVIREGYWTTHLDTVERIKAVPAPDAPVESPVQTPQIIRVHADRPVTFLGAERAVEKGGGEYEVTVKLPGAFSVVWAKPTALGATPVYVGELPATATLQRLANGVVCLRNVPAYINRAMVQHIPGASMSAEGTVEWLLTLPSTPVRLAFRYGASHGYGDGANYMVRVNGRSLWKKYFNETAADPAEAAAHKGVPARPDSVDLSAYAGQTIVLELAVNGHYSPGSDIMLWTEPRLEMPAK